jgi:cardiolipin synthase
MSEGFMWDSIFDILKRKASEGVDVRLMYDDIGSMSRLPISFPKKLEEVGIKCVVFNPLKPIASLVYNNRDHRKIMVVDGYIGYCGGYNIGDEYINRVKRFGHWKDTGVRIEGRGVWNLTVMFLNIWNAYRESENNYDAFKPEANCTKVFEDDGFVQPFGDSPLDEENMGQNVYMELINQAEDYVYIFTPYLIPDSEMISCMQIAAKRGVDIRIVTPAIPDKHVVFRLTRSYYRPLIKAGVKIYEYTPGFMHAKSFIVDDRIAVVGSMNIDYRSLYLHFECALLMIGSSAIQSLKKDCMNVFGLSRQISKEDCRSNFFGTLFDSILRVLAPLM